MTPEKARYYASMIECKGVLLPAKEVAEHYRGYAAALDEIERLNRDLAIMTRRADNEERAMERAEKAERRIAELEKYHD